MVSTDASQKEQKHKDKLHKEKKHKDKDKKKHKDKDKKKHKEKEPQALVVKGISAPHKVSANASKTSKGAAQQDVKKETNKRKVSFTEDLDYSSDDEDALEEYVTDEEYGAEGRSKVWEQMRRNPRQQLWLIQLPGDISDEDLAGGTFDVHKNDDRLGLVATITTGTGEKLTVAGRSNLEGTVAIPAFNNDDKAMALPIQAQLTAVRSQTFGLSEYEEDDKEEGVPVRSGGPGRASKKQTPAEKPQGQAPVAKTPKQKGHKKHSEDGSKSVKSEKTTEKKKKKKTEG